MRKPQVTILVGKDEVKYFLPKELLVQDKLPFFKAAFTNPSYEEYATNTMKLPEDEVPSFDLFVHWLFFNTVKPIEILSKHFFHFICENGEAGHAQARKAVASAALHGKPILLSRVGEECAGRNTGLPFPDPDGVSSVPLGIRPSQQSPSQGIDGYIVEEFCRITFGPDQDFNKMLDFLHVQCPTTLIEGVKKMRNKAVAWPMIPQSKRVNGGV